MKASCILLRWYKSFNVNYLGYPDRRHQVKERPWTRLRIPEDMDDRFRFIEIPLEQDITTIVGGNESGKSHLLSAVAKVVLGTGIPDDRDNSSAFDRTDLCHYASIRDKNADAWPNIGLEFSQVTASEWSGLSDAVGKDLGPHTGANCAFTLICAPEGAKAEDIGEARRSIVAYLYPQSSKHPFELDETALAKVRAVLPKAHFIKSDLALRDELPIDDLLAGLGHPRANGKEFFPFEVSQGAAGFLKTLVIPAQTNANDIKTLLDSLQAQVAAVNHPVAGAKESDNGTTLEGRLFREVLEIDPSAISLLASLPETSRSYADSLVGTWNDEIAKVLNLSRYWQQDESFSLRIDFKRGMLHFELTDKTGAIYTFRERSSGLRYFLSYYIQAKALEKAITSGSALILMDEPDSYLSILGQRNLLSVFESLVGFATAEGHVQLVYTTHSPFLINRNFPRRIRLVRKGDAEEGSQFIDQSRLRRYEPVRSALGIDCAQTLFMGSTNVLLEGTTDQFLIGELIRAFSRPDNVHDLLDLNTITLVSAESAPNVRHVLAASRWADEPIPATVVLFDNDEAGRMQKAKITGNFNSAKDKKDDTENYSKLIDERFVLLISDCLGEMLDDRHKCVTVEDIIPLDLWKEALDAFLAKWMPDVDAGSRDIISSGISGDGAKEGIIAATKAVLTEALGKDKAQIDKMGILQAVVDILLEGCAAKEAPSWLSESRSRVTRLCQKLTERIEESRKVQRRATGKQALKRIAHDFLIEHPKAVGLFEVQLFLNRISREADLLGPEAAKLKKTISQFLEETNELRAQNQESLSGQQWSEWRKRYEAIRDNPLDPTAGNVPVKAMDLSIGTGADHAHVPNDV